MKIIALLITIVVSSTIAPLQAQDEPRRPNISMKLEVRHAIDKGLRWLKEQRKADGSWSEEQHPAITALAVSAFLGDPSRDRTEPLPDFINESLDYIVGNAKRDGGIYGKGLGNYNTSVSMMALLMADRLQDKELLINARRFITSQQSDFGIRGEIDHPMDGGIGYGGSYAHSDLSNTHLALEALYHSRSLVADDPKEEAYDLNWDAAIAFVSRCQNLPETNDEEWASDDPENKGGFVYFPGDSKAGEMNLENGKIALRSYGSMSYAGLLSLIYAEVNQDDPRVQAVIEWLEGNFAIVENPGLGLQGLYYYYHTMAKALSRAGIDELETTDGMPVVWREELSKHLFNLQEPNGQWVNENNRWWEGDPILASSYAILALEHLYSGL